MRVRYLVALLKEAFSFITFVLRNAYKALHAPCIHLGLEAADNTIEKFNLDNSLQG